MKFEYKTFQVKLDDSDLNKLGDQGWELVSHTAVAVSSLMGSGFGQYYVFKRVKKD